MRLPWKRILKSSSLGRGTHVPRSWYTCPSVGVRMYFGRGTMTLCALLCSFVLFKTIKWVRQEL